MQMTETGEWCLFTDEQARALLCSGGQTPFDLDTVTPVYRFTDRSFVHLMRDLEISSPSRPMPERGPPAAPLPSRTVPGTGRRSPAAPSPPPAVSRALPRAPAALQPVAGTSRATLGARPCFLCGDSGHLMGRCPAKDEVKACRLCGALGFTKDTCPDLKCREIRRTDRATGRNWGPRRTAASRKRSSTTGRTDKAKKSHVGDLPAPAPLRLRLPLTVVEKGKSTQSIPYAAEQMALLNRPSTSVTVNDRTPQALASREVMFPDRHTDRFPLGLREPGQPLRICREQDAVAGAPAPASSSSPPTAEWHFSPCSIKDPPKPKASPFAEELERLTIITPYVPHSLNPAYLYLPSDPENVGNDVSTAE